MMNLGNRMVNNWLIPGEDGYILVDTGYETGFQPFLQRLSRAHIPLRRIKYLFLTHAHDDHAGFLNQLLENAPHVKVVLSEKAPEVLRRGQNSFSGGCTGRQALYFCQLMKLFGKGAHRFPPLQAHFENRLLLVTEDNREELGKRLGGTILFTPGHTTDSISLLTGDGSLFCGDAAMNGFPSVHNKTIWAQDRDDFLASWETIIRQKPYKIYPGHGRAFSWQALQKNLEYVRTMPLYALESSL